MKPTDDILANPSTINKEAQWSRVDIGALWASDFWPILRDDVKLQGVHTQCVNSWLKTGRAHTNTPKRWRYSETAESPFFFTSTDGACQWVDNRIDEAREADDPRAYAYEALMTILCGEHDLSLPKSAEAALWREANKIEAEFHPQRDEHPEWWRPGHSCHWIAPFALCLAAAWRPDLEWRILSGDMHSTVICEAEKLIFDILLWDDKEIDIIDFATRPAPEEAAA